MGQMTLVTLVECARCGRLIYGSDVGGDEQQDGVKTTGLRRQRPSTFYLVKAWFHTGRCT